MKPTLDEIYKNSAQRPSLDSIYGGQTASTVPDNIAQAGIKTAKEIAAGILSPAESIKNAATTYGGAAVSTLLGNIFGDHGATYQDYVNQNKQTLADNSITKNILGGEAPNTPDLTTAKGYGQLAGDLGQTALNVVGGGVAKGVGKEVAAGALGKIIPALKSAGIGYGYDVTGNLAKTGDVTDMSTYAPGAGTVFGAVAPVLSKVITKSTPQTDETLFRDITSQFNQAIKPTVVGKSNSTAVTKYGEQTMDALKAVADNKDLKFIDESGQIVSRTPQTLGELPDAISQTKANIYKQYNDLAKQAGGQGVQLNLNTIGSELDPIINSKSLAISNPSTIEYAAGIKDRLSKAGSIDAETAEEVIKNYNDNLKAFYKNPNYDTASKVGVDALVANKMRSQLDSLIEGATGKEYQSLKNLYGSLKAIEKDVIKRSIVNDRKQPVGLMDYADIFSAGDLLTGLATMNPAMFAKGAVQKGIKEYLKHLNNPDTAIKGIFKKLENYRVTPITNPMQNPTISAKNATIPQTVAQSNVVDKGVVPSNQSLRDYLLGKKPYVPEDYVPDTQLPTIDMGPTAISKYKADTGLPTAKGLPEVAGELPKDSYLQEAYIPESKLPVIRSLLGVGGAGALALSSNKAEAANPVGADNAQTRAQLDNGATTTVGKTEMQSKVNPVYSAYDNEITNAEALVKKTLGSNLPKGLVKTVLALESAFGTNPASYNPSLGENAWLMGLTADAKKELAARLKGEFTVDPSLIDTNTIQGAINASALYLALKARVSRGQDATGSKIIDTIVEKQLLSDPTKLYSTKYSNRSQAAKQAFQDRYNYIREN